MMRTLVLVNRSLPRTAARHYRATAHLCEKPVSGQWTDRPMDFETKAVHAGVRPDPITGAILTPIYQSTTFVQDSIEEYLGKGYSYSRTGNPTVRALEEKIAALEGGAGATCVATGMAATLNVMHSFLEAGDHCVITETSYGGTNRACREVLSQLGITFDFVDFTDPSIVEAAIQPNTKLVFSESPSNPTLTIPDLAAISAITKPLGILHACDSTFATPVITKPLDYGCDLVVHSTTKYFDGHNMTVGGAVVAATPELHARGQHLLNFYGTSMAPQTAFLTLQTTKTLALRMRRQSATAQKLAEMLEQHPMVDFVTYPGLASFPQKELADRQHADGIHGNMLSFEVKGGTESGRKLMNTLPRPWSLCENLGATESIATCPAVMTHANMLAEDRMKVGITDGFVRISCGIEDPDDLIHGLQLALDGLQ